MGDSQKFKLLKMKKGDLTELRIKSLFEDFPYEGFDEYMEHLLKESMYMVENYEGYHMQKCAERIEQAIFFLREAFKE